MGVFDYLQSLLPNNETANIRRNISNIKKVVGKHTLPSAESLITVIDANWQFKNADMAKLNKFFSAELPKKMDFKFRNPNMLQCAVYGLQCLDKNLDIIDNLTVNLFKSESFSASTLSYNKANILQYVEAADFYVRYVRCLLNFASTTELAEVQNVKDTKGYGPSDLEYLKSRSYDFVRVSTIISLNTNKTKEALSKTSDMLVTGDDSATKVVVGSKGIDPLGFSNLPFPISFIFRVRMGAMSCDVDNYEAAKSEALSVEYRVMLLKEHIENGYGDAVVEKSLEVQEDRLLKLKRKIEEMEEEYDVN